MYKELLFWIHLFSETLKYIKFVWIKLVILRLSLRQWFSHSTPLGTGTLYVKADCAFLTKKLPICTYLHVYTRFSISKPCCRTLKNSTIFKNYIMYTLFLKANNCPLSLVVFLHYKIDVILSQKCTFFIWYKQTLNVASAKMISCSEFKILFYHGCFNFKK